MNTIQILRTSNYIIAKFADKSLSIDKTLYVKCIHTGRFSKHSDALKELEQQNYYNEYHNYHHEYIASVIALMTCLMSVIVGGLYLYGVPIIVSILSATMLLCFITIPIVVYQNTVYIDQTM